MNYTVNLGCWGSIFAVPTDVVDKHLKIAGSAQLKVLLYILRHSQNGFSENDIASALNMDPFDVKDCIEFWTSFDVIKLSGNVIEPAEKVGEKPREKHSQSDRPIEPDFEAAKPQSHEEPPLYDNGAKNEADTKTEEREREKELPSPTVVARPLRPDPIYVAKRINEDSEIAALLNEAQYILGRPVSPNENAGLIMLHDNDGLPCEVILMLLTYGASNQMGMRQIEAQGAKWAKEGIYTVEAADEKIRRLDESNEAFRKVQRILGLDHRKPSANEQEMFTRWIFEWKFSDDMIKEAYDVCIDAKGKYIPNYVNRVLNNWYNSGIRTVEQARLLKKRGAQNNSSSSAGNSSFDVDQLSGLGMFDD